MYTFFHTIPLMENICKCSTISNFFILQDVIEEAKQQYAGKSHSEVHLPLLDVSASGE